MLSHMHQQYRPNRAVYLKFTFVTMKTEMQLGHVCEEDAYLQRAKTVGMHFAKLEQFIAAVCYRMSYVSRP